MPSLCVLCVVCQKCQYTQYKCQCGAPHTHGSTFLQSSKFQEFYRVTILAVCSVACHTWLLPCLIHVPSWVQLLQVPRRYRRVHTHTYIHQSQPLPTATRVLKTGSTASHNNVPCMDSILQSCPAFLRRNKSIVGGCCQQTQGYNVVAIFFPIGSVVPHTCPTQES